MFNSMRRAMGWLISAMGAWALITNAVMALRSVFWALLQHGGPI